MAANKNEVVKKIQKYLKHEVPWKQWDKNFNIAKEYNGEEYMFLTGRDNIKSATLESINFVDHYTAQCMLKFCLYFRALLVRLEDMSTVEEKGRCICITPHKDQKQQDKVRCWYCKQYGKCDFENVRHCTK